MKPCLRCSILYALAAPPLIGWLMLRKMIKSEGFKEAAEGLKDKIAEYQRLGQRLEDAMNRKGENSEP